MDKKTLGHLLLIGVFAVAAMLPVYFNGIPSGNDQSQHYQFAWTIYNSVRSGDLYPSFAGDTNHGRGDYGLRFYPPGTYYVLSLIYAVVGDWYVASLIALTLVFFLGGVGIFLWAKEEFEPNQALAAAVLYTFAPYHLNQIYNNFLLAEFFSMAIVPFCFLFLTRVLRTGGWTAVAGFSISFALLILTHLPMTILVSIAMGIYTLILLRKRDLLVTAMKLVAAGISALAMTTFYWARWVPELAWIKHSAPKYFSTTWDYRSNFLMLPEHFLNFGDDALNLWFADLWVIVMLLISIPSIVYLIRSRTFGSRYVVTLGAVLTSALFMTTPLSGFIWDHLAFLQKVQFPWRWMAIVSVFGAVFASIGIFQASSALKASKNILLPVGLGLILAAFVFMAAFITKGSVYIPRAELNRQLANISEYDGCECWWPVWAQASAFGQTERVAAGDRVTDIRSWLGTDKQFHIAAGAPVTATIAAFYYPRWQATINGAKIPVEDSEDGTISIQVPAEAADVRLTFYEPAYVKAAYVVSIAAWLIAALFLAFLLSRRRTQPITGSRA